MRASGFERSTGLLKRSPFGNPLKHVAFSTQIEGNHHLQGNVQVYNVRIPAQVASDFLPTNSRKLRKAFVNGEHSKEVLRLPWNRLGEGRSWVIKSCVGFRNRRFGAKPIFFFWVKPTSREKSNEGCNVHELMAHWKTKTDLDRQLRALFPSTLP